MGCYCLVVLGLGLGVMGYVLQDNCYVLRGVGLRVRVRG